MFINLKFNYIPLIAFLKKSILMPKPNKNPDIFFKILFQLFI